MRAKHWLIGCILFTVGSSAATASSRSAQDLDNASHAIADTPSTPRDGSSDVTDLTSRNSAPRNPVHDAAGNSPGIGNDHSGNGGSAPPPVRQPHLGWQSLLPGSIQ